MFSLQVKVVDWMRGQTCGLCGKADGEIRQEYRTPNERLTKNAASYAHSWVLPGKSCRDASGKTESTNSNQTGKIYVHAPCLPFSCSPSSRVLHEARIREAGESDDPPRPGVQVLLCGACAALSARLPASEDHHRQCWLPLPSRWWVCKTSQQVPKSLINRTTSSEPNCLILSTVADSNVDSSEGLSSIYQKSIDIQEEAEAHLACRCTAQCAWSEHLQDFNVFLYLIFVSSILQLYHKEKTDTCEKWIVWDLLQLQLVFTIAKHLYQEMVLIIHFEDMKTQAECGPIWIYCPFIQLAASSITGNYSSFKVFLRAVQKSSGKITTGIMIS